MSETLGSIHSWAGFETGLGPKLKKRTRPNREFRNRFSSPTDYHPSLPRDREGSPPARHNTAAGRAACGDSRQAGTTSSTTTAQTSRSYVTCCGSAAAQAQAVNHLGVSRAGGVFTVDSDSGLYKPAVAKHYSHGRVVRRRTLRLVIPLNPRSNPYLIHLLHRVPRCKYLFTCSLTVVVCGAVQFNQMA
jgi:hypothetical protein